MIQLFVDAEVLEPKVSATAGHGLRRRQEKESIVFLEKENTSTKKARMVGTWSAWPSAWLVLGVQGEWPVTAQNVCMHGALPSAWGFSRLLRGFYLDKAMIRTF